ncbi:hypothetical protein KCP77_21990 [Salmonella enterica subsp. enterica]|nr:hypothetical protein KCP77_21990 [Salmonella enterica subsp. enterica]
MKIKAEAAGGNGGRRHLSAINRITGYDVELVKYDLNAKGENANALGQVDIVVNHHGRRFTASGWRRISSNPPPKAMVHVLNNIWRAAEVEKRIKRSSNKRATKETV